MRVLLEYLYAGLSSIGLTSVVAGISSKAPAACCQGRDTYLAVLTRMHTPEKPPLPTVRACPARPQGRGRSLTGSRTTGFEKVLKLPR
jgi:hypothetical protein